MSTSERPEVGLREAVEALAGEWLADGDDLVRNCSTGRDVNEGEQLKSCARSLRALLAEHPAAAADPTAGERPYCLRCEAPIYLDGDVWRREATGSQSCPRNPASDAA